VRTRFLFSSHGISRASRKAGEKILEFSYGVYPLLTVSTVARDKIFLTCSVARQGLGGSAVLFSVKNAFACIVDGGLPSILAGPFKP
jgi:hypothetical protein